MATQIKYPEKFRKEKDRYNSWPPGNGAVYVQSIRGGYTQASESWVQGYRAAVKDIKKLNN